MTNSVAAQISQPLPGMAACTACGHDLHQTAPICPSCGASQRSRGYKSKVVAGLLAIFLGGLGVHRFYLGQWWGVFYLLLFWTLIPGLIALFEGIVFLARSQESWDARHNDGKPNLGGEGSVGLVVALVVGGFAAIIVVGILAAIAIPAYQDYTLRAKVAGAFAASKQPREAVKQFIIDYRAYPTSNADVGLPEEAAADARQTFVVGDEGVIVMTLTGPLQLRDQTVEFTPIIENNTLRWDCRGGTLKSRYRPPECR